MYSDSDGSEGESNDAEEEGIEDFDPNIYYFSTASQFAKVVTEYIENCFRKMHPQRAVQEDAQGEFCQSYLIM